MKNDVTFHPSQTRVKGSKDSKGNVVAVACMRAQEFFKVLTNVGTFHIIESDMTDGTTLIYAIGIVPEEHDAEVSRILDEIVRGLQERINAKNYNKR